MKNEGKKEGGVKQTCYSALSPLLMSLGLALSDWQVAHYAMRGEMPAGTLSTERKGGLGVGRREEKRAGKRMMECV